MQHAESSETKARESSQNEKAVVPTTGGLESGGVESFTSAPMIGLGQTSSSWVFKNPAPAAVLFKRSQESTGSSDWSAMEARPLGAVQRKSEGSALEDIPVQRKEAPHQRGAESSSQASVPQALSSIISPALESQSAPLPHQETIQAAFGKHDIRGIQAHMDKESTGLLGAEGFATGNHVVFQSAPDLRLAAHEAAHVVQQRSGVQLSTGVSRPGDALEQHADAVADRVVQGKSAEGLLDSVSGHGGSSQSPVQRAGGPDWAARTQSLMGKICATNKHAMILERSGWNKTGEAIPPGTEVEVLEVHVAHGAVRVSWDGRQAWTYQYAVAPTGATKKQSSSGTSNSSASGSNSTQKPKTTTTTPQNQQAPTQNQGKGLTADVKIGNYTKVGIDVKIVIWGPFKFAAKVEGTWTTKAGAEAIGSGNARGVMDGELEVSVYGGLEADFIFFVLSAGVEGKIKFSVENELAMGGPKEAIAAGMKEVMNWYLARKVALELKPKAQAAKKTLGTHQAAIDTELKRLKAAVAAGDWQGEAQRTSWYEFWKNDTVLDRVDGHLTDIENTIKGTFNEFEVKGDPSKMANRQQLLTQIGAVASAPNKQTATSLANKAEQNVKAGVTKTVSDFSGVIDKAGQPENDPRVGFEGSLMFKAGAKAQLSQKLGIEVSGGIGWKISDEKGQKEDNGKVKAQQEWDTKVKDVKQLAVKGTYDVVEVSGAGTWESDRVKDVKNHPGKQVVAHNAKINISFTMEKVKFATGAAKGDPETARDFGQRFGSSLQAVTKGAVPAGAGEQLKFYAKAFSDVFKVKNAESKAGSKGSAKGGAEVELVWKGEEDVSTKQLSMRFSEATVKIFWIPISISVSGKAGVAELSGSIEQGGFVELKFQW